MRFVVITVQHKSSGFSAQGRRVEQIFCLVSADPGSWVLWLFPAWQAGGFFSGGFRISIRVGKFAFRICRRAPVDGFRLVDGCW